MNTRKRWFLWSVAALVPLTAVLVLVLKPRKPFLPPHCTPQQLQAVLARSGLVYEGKYLAGGEDSLPGFYLRRDGRPWEELAAPSIRQFAKSPGHLRIEVLPGDFAEHSSLYEYPDKLQLQSLLIYGHPDELKQVMEALSR